MLNSYDNNLETIPLINILNTKSIILLSNFEKLECPSQSSFEKEAQGESSNLFSHKELFTFSFFSCLQQLAIIRSWLPNLIKLPKIQKKLLWETCLSIKESFQNQNITELNEKSFNKNPDFVNLIEKWTNDPLFYLTSITVFFGAVGYLVENNFIKNEYYYPLSSTLVYNTQETEHIKKKKKLDSVNNNILNKSYINNNISSSDEESDTESEYTLDSSQSLPRSISLPSLPTLPTEQSLNNKNYIKKSQRNVPTTTTTTTTTLSANSSPILSKRSKSESSQKNNRILDKPLSPSSSPIYNQLLDEIESDEDYFEEKPIKRSKSSLSISSSKINNSPISSSSKKNKKRSNLSKSCDNFTVPSVSPTRELFNTTPLTSSIISSPLLDIVQACEIEDVECIEEDVENELVNIKKTNSSIDLNSSFISIKNYKNNNNNKQSNNNLLSSSSSSLLGNSILDLDGSMDSLFGLANFVTNEATQDQELKSQ